MLAKRIIPCLDVKNSMVVKGVNFKNLVDVGDPLELAINYNLQKADELVFLDISATLDKRKLQLELAKNIARNIFIPFAIGGGITSLQQIIDIVRNGADKVIINSAAFKNRQLINEGVRELGSQCIVVAIDIKKINDSWQVFIDAGTKATSLNAIDWALEVEDRGAGEIILTSMDRDGTKLGFDLDITKIIGEKLKIPVIASGGVGTLKHFKDAFSIANADGALAASVFHNNVFSIKQVKHYLLDNQITVRL